MTDIMIEVAKCVDCAQTRYHHQYHYLNVETSITTVTHQHGCKQTHHTKPNKADDRRIAPGEENSTWQKNSKDKLDKIEITGQIFISTDQFVYCVQNIQ